MRSRCVLIGAFMIIQIFVFPTIVSCCNRVAAKAKLVIYFMNMFSTNPV